MSGWMSGNCFIDATWDGVSRIAQEYIAGDYTEKSIHVVELKSESLKIIKWQWEDYPLHKHRFHEQVNYQCDEKYNPEYEKALTGPHYPAYSHWWPTYLGDQCQLQLGDCWSCTKTTNVCKLHLKLAVTAIWRVQSRLTLASRVTFVGTIESNLWRGKVEPARGRSGSEPFMYIINW